MTAKQLLCIHFISWKQEYTGSESGDDEMLCKGNNFMAVISIFARRIGEIPTIKYGKQSIKEVCIFIK